MLPARFDNIILVFLILFSSLNSSFAVSVSYPGAKSEISLPGSLGTVTARRNNGSRDTVVVIQTLHCHPPTQFQIARILQYLKEKSGLRDVFVEGAAGPVDLSWIRDIKNPARREKAAAYLVNKGYLTGAEYFGIVSDDNVPMAGLENRDLYFANLKRLARIYEEDGQSEQLADMKKNITNLARESFSPRQCSFDSLCQSFLAGKTDSLSYSEKLVARAGECRIPVNLYPDVALCAGAGRFLVSSSEKRARRELERFHNDARNFMPYTRYRSFTEGMRDLSASVDFWPWLSGFIEREGISSGIKVRYPSLYAFSRGHALLKLVNPSGFIFEERALRRGIMVKLASNEGERDAAFMADYFPAFTGYLRADANPEDVRYVESNFTRFKFLSRELLDTDVPAAIIPSFERVKEYYRVNEQRNNAFIQVVTGNRQGSGNGTVTAMVAGGYHAEGIARMLDRKGISYVVVMPVMENAGLASAEKLYHEKIGYWGNVREAATEPPLASTESEATKNALRAEAEAAIDASDLHAQTPDISKELAGLKNSLSVFEDPSGVFLEPKSADEIKELLFQAYAHGYSAVEIYADRLIGGLTDGKDQVMRNLERLNASAPQLCVVAKTLGLEIVVHTHGFSFHDGSRWRFPEPVLDAKVFDAWLEFGQAIGAKAITVHLTDPDDEKAIRGMADYAEAVHKAGLVMMLENTKFVRKSVKCTNDDELYNVESRFHTYKELIHGVQGILSRLSSEEKRSVGITFDTAKAYCSPDPETGGLFTDVIKYYNCLVAQPGIQIFDVHFAQCRSERYQKEIISDSGGIDIIALLQRFREYSKEQFPCWINQETGSNGVVHPRMKNKSVLRRTKNAARMMTKIMRRDAEKPILSMAATSVLDCLEQTSGSVDIKRLSRQISFFFDERELPRYFTNLLLGNPFRETNVLDALCLLRDDLRRECDPGNRFLYLSDPAHCHITVFAKEDVIHHKDIKERVKSLKGELEAESVEIGRIVRQAGVRLFKGTLKGSLKFHDDGSIILCVTDPMAIEQIARIRFAIRGPEGRPRIVHISIGRISNRNYSPEDISKIQAVLQRHNEQGTLNVPFSANEFHYGITSEQVQRTIVDYTICLSKRMTQRLLFLGSNVPRVLVSMPATARAAQEHNMYGASWQVTFSEEGEYAGNIGLDDFPGIGRRMLVRVFVSLKNDAGGKRITVFSFSPEDGAIQDPRMAAPMLGRGTLALFHRMDQDRVFRKKLAAIGVDIRREELRGMSVVLDGAETIWALPGAMSDALSSDPISRSLSFTFIPSAGVRAFENGEIVMPVHMTRAAFHRGVTDLNRLGIMLADKVLAGEGTVALYPDLTAIIAEKTGMAGSQFNDPSDISNTIKQGFDLLFEDQDLKSLLSAA